MIKAYLYWIRKPEHTDITTQGYVGVTQDVTERWRAHSTRYECKKLANARDKYGWDNLKKSVVCIADEDYLYDLENKLRPTKNIGWNINTGGQKPPITKGQDHWAYGSNLWSGENNPFYGSSRKGAANPMFGKKRPDLSERNKQKHAEGFKPMLGKSHSEETKKRLQQVSSNRVKDQYCEHCGNNFTKQSYTQWHGDKCKQKEQQ